MHHHRLIALPLSLVLVLMRAAAAQEPPRIDVPEDQPYSHESSGTVFPAEIGSIKRSGVVRYDETGDNISASYRLRQPRFTITVYVYPIEGEELDAHFDQITQDIAKVHAGVKTVEKRPWKLTQAGKQHTGRRAKFTITGFAGTDREMISELYLLQIGEWFMKYRISYPATSSDSAPKVIAALHDGVKVPKE